MGLFVLVLFYFFIDCVKILLSPCEDLCEYGHIKIAPTKFQVFLLKYKIGGWVERKELNSWPTIFIYTFSTMGMGVSIRSWQKEKKVTWVALSV